MRLYTYPLNYKNNRTSPVEAADNRYDTVATVGSIVCNIDERGDGTGAAREWTDVFVKGKGIAGFTITVLGGSGSAGAIIPATRTNDSGDAVSTTDLDDFQNILIDNPSGIPATKDTGQRITLNFTAKAGETLQIAEVMILNEMLRFEERGALRQDNLSFIDSGRIHTGAAGRQTHIPALNNERDKWQLTTAVLGTYSNRVWIDQLIHFIRNNKNCACAPEINRYPNLIAPCVFPNAEKQTAYIGNNKSNGRTCPLTIREA